jgi:hypothetical protein
MVGVLDDRWHEGLARAEDDERLARQSVGAFRRLPVYALSNRALSAFDPQVAGRPLIVVVDRAHVQEHLSLRVLLEFAGQRDLHLLTPDPHDDLPTLTVGEYLEAMDYFAVEYDNWSTGARVTAIPAGAAWRQRDGGGGLPRRDCATRGQLSHSLCIRPHGSAPGLCPVAPARQ